MKKWRSYRSCGSEAWKTKLQPGTQTNTWKYVSKNSLISLLQGCSCAFWHTHTFFLEERITTLCVAIITFFISESIFQSFDLLTILQEINLNMALCSCRIIKNNSTLLKLSNLFVSQQIHLLIDDHPLSWWASQVCKQLVEATTLALGSIFFSTSIRRIHPQRGEPRYPFKSCQKSMSLSMVRSNGFEPKKLPWSKVASLTRSCQIILSRLKRHNL